MAGDATQRIASAVTPAVMVSACALAALGLDNQAARVSARLRDLARELRQLPAQSPRREHLPEQIRVLGRRHRIYTWALMLNYAALLAFVCTSLLYLEQPAIGLPKSVPIIAFTCGVVLLGAMAVLVLASLRLSRSAIVLEERQTLARAP
jgi:hypothetical protein